MTSDQMTEPPRILIADDDETFLSATTELLGRAGYTCDGVRDAQHAIAALNEQEYALLIADINMPGNENLELLRILQDRRPIIPVLIATGSPTIHTAIEALRLAVVDYLIKPLQFPAVLGQIRYAVEKGRFLRVLQQARDETGEWTRTLDQLERAVETASVARASPQLSARPIEEYLNHVTAQMIKLALSFKATMGLVQSGQAEGAADFCALVPSPRLAAYEAALRETIEVLKKTKHAFRSKDLAHLRQRIEKLLEQGRGG